MATGRQQQARNIDARRDEAAERQIAQQQRGRADDPQDGGREAVGELPGLDGHPVEVASDRQRRHEVPGPHRMAGVPDADEEPGQVGQQREIGKAGVADQGRQQRDDGAGAVEGGGEAGERRGGQQPWIATDGEQGRARHQRQQREHEEGGEELAPAEQPLHGDDVDDQLRVELLAIDEEREGEG